jgi:glycosyltransferase involved in cell wall biosynthesis
LTWLRPLCYNAGALITKSTEGPHIAVNAHLLAGQSGYRSAGVHQYVYHLLVGLSCQEGGLRCTALAGRRPLPAEIAIPSSSSRWPTHRPAIRVLWEQLSQPQTLARIGADLVHCPAFVGPLIGSCPSVVTIHDLSFLRYPSFFRLANRVYLSAFTRLSARRARRVIAVSGHAAQEASRLLGVEPERIDVVYNGVDPDFRPLPDESVERFREARGLPATFLLFVGTLEPRKNLVRLLQAFSRLRQGQVKLVVAGGLGWMCDELWDQVVHLGLAESVVFTGYLPREELPMWYNAALALVYPSLYEGFGLPVVEAQACGTPVIASSGGALPEVAGDAALLTDPRDVSQMRDQMDRVVKDRAIRRELAARGIANARRFSWQNTVESTVQTYRRALVEG